MTPLKKQTPNFMRCFQKDSEYMSMFLICACIFQALNVHTFKHDTIIMCILYMFVVHNDDIFIDHISFLMFLLLWLIHPNLPLKTQVWSFMKSWLSCCVGEDRVFGISGNITLKGGQPGGCGWWLGGYPPEV